MHGSCRFALRTSLFTPCFCYGTPIFSCCVLGVVAVHSHCLAPCFMFSFAARASALPSLPRIFLHVTVLASAACLPCHAFAKPQGGEPLKQDGGLRCLVWLCRFGSGFLDNLFSDRDGVQLWTRMLTRSWLWSGNVESVVESQYKTSVRDCGGGDVGSCALQTKTTGARVAAIASVCGRPARN